MNTDRIQAHGFQILERFELGVARLTWHGSLVDAPVVDGWLQIEREILHGFGVDEEQALFAAFAAVRRVVVGTPWYWLYKSPGLKLRVRVGADTALAARVLTAVEGLKGEWLGETALGGYFDQAELRPPVFREDAEAWLHAAAETLLDVSELNARVDPAAWSRMLIELGRRIFGDDWISYEAYSRLARLRAPWLGQRASLRPTNDPAPLVQRLPPLCALGFETSVAFLQTLNMIFNMWGLDGAGQADALSSACKELKPPLIGERR